MALKTKDKDEDLKFERQPENDHYISKNEYSFNGNFSLEYVSGTYKPHLMCNINYFVHFPKCIDFRIAFAQIEGQL